VHVDAKTYRAYTVEGGEHAQIISFGLTNLKPKTFIRIRGQAQKPAISGSMFPKTDFFGFDRIDLVWYMILGVNVEEGAEILTRTKIFLFLKPILRCFFF
jgi:hypothetical protein